VDEGEIQGESDQGRGEQEQRGKRDKLASPAFRDERQHGAGEPEQQHWSSGEGGEGRSALSRKQREDTGDRLAMDSRRHDWRKRAADQDRNPPPAGRVVLAEVDGGDQQEQAERHGWCRQPQRKHQTSQR
jgi:hypothetical protein